MAAKNNDDEIEKTESLLDSVPKTYSILINHYDILCKNLPKNLMKLCRFIAEYRNRHIRILETPYPTDYPPWTKDCDKILYTVTGINEDDFLESVMSIRGMDKFGNEYIDPYLNTKCSNILLTLIVRYCIENKKTKELAIIQHFIGYSFYWMVFVRFFKRYKPDPAVVQYTITNMSYKNLLKSIGSVDEWLYQGVKASFETYDDRLKVATDYYLYYIPERIRIKFNGYMMSLYREIDANAKAGNRIFITQDEVDGVGIDNTSGVADIISIAEKYTTKFFADPINEAAIRSSKIAGGVSERDLRNTILLIADDNENLDDVRSFYQSLFFIYFENNDKSERDIGTLRFYEHMSKIYKSGNTNDQNRLKIRSIMDKWLKMGSAAYRNSNRADTLSKFRRTIYEYFIIKILKDK